MTEADNENEIPTANDDDLEIEAAIEEELGGAEDEAPVDQAAELKDQLLRALAEVENVRRRAKREVEDARKYAVASFAKDILTVGDNLGRALMAVPEDADNDDLRALIDGVSLTERELLSVMERHGIRKIEPKGEKFDHNLHQAMFEVDAPDAEPGTVIEVAQPGYVIGDRLLRPAMVGVAKRKAPAATGTEPPEGGDQVDTKA